MINISKINDPRSWHKWRKAGAVGDLHSAYLQKARHGAQRYNAERASILKDVNPTLRRNFVDPIIRENLERILEAYNLKDRVTLDEEALVELTSISQGNWRTAKVYAGTAVLDALQNRKGVITLKDIQKVDIAEAIALMLGGKDIWDDARYIGTRVPDMYPEEVQLKRLLSLWDADRERHASDSIREGRLPQYTLVDRIEFTGSGLLGQPEVKIPLEYDPSKDEVRAVAENVARFVTQYTGEPQEVQDISPGNDAFGFGIQYFIRSQALAGKDPLLSSPNYRVAKGFALGIIGAQGIVTISRESLCKHDNQTLEAYVQTLRPKGK